MKNVKLTFSMLIDGSPHTAFTVRGTLLESRLVFSNPEGTLYRLEMNPPRLSISKTGKSSVHLVLEEGFSTEGSVRTAEMTLPIDVKTTRLVFSQTSIEALYELLDENAVLSRHALRLGWKPDESTRKEPTQTWLK